MPATQQSCPVKQHAEHGRHKQQNKCTKILQVALRAQTAASQPVQSYRCEGVSMSGRVCLKHLVLSPAAAPSTTAPMAPGTATDTAADAAIALPAPHRRTARL